MLCSRSWVNRIYKSSIKGFLVIHIERLPATQELKVGRADNHYFSGLSDF